MYRWNLIGEVEFLDVWHQSYAAVMHHSRASNGFWVCLLSIYLDATEHSLSSGMSTSIPEMLHFSLSIPSPRFGLVYRFWVATSRMRLKLTLCVIVHYSVPCIPGLMPFAADWNLWKKFSGLPEVFDTAFLQATSWQYPLRPGMSLGLEPAGNLPIIQNLLNPLGTSIAFVVLSNACYRCSRGAQATRDPFYLDVGERVLNDIESRTKVECGLAGVSDLLSNTLSDRMESFVLSETLKVLFFFPSSLTPCLILGHYPIVPIFIV